MKKIISIFSLCIILSLIVLSPVSVSAKSNSTSDDSVSVDISDISLDSQENEAFNKDVADDDIFFGLVEQSAKHRGKDVSLDGIHSGKSIKLYGLKGSENILQSLYDSYIETGTMKDMIGKDYAVLKLYVNKDNEYVDSLVFTKQKNLPGATAKNGWVELCSGSMILKDEFIVKYSEAKNLKQLVKDLGLKNTKHLKLISSIPNMPVSIYFVQNDTEFLIPLEDAVNMEEMHVYKVSDVFENYLKPILDYQNEKAKEYENLDPKDRPNGTPPIPDKFPSIASIDLHNEGVANDVLVTETEKKSGFPAVGWLAAVVIIGGLGVCCIVKKRKSI